jgi:hypothetical protein
MIFHNLNVIPLCPMKKKRYYFLLMFFLVLQTQSSTASVSLRASSFHHPDLQMNKFVLPDGSASSEATYQSESDDDYFFSDLVDDDNETEPSVKNKLQGINNCLKNAQWSFIQLCSDAHFKYQFPYNLASPQFIVYGALRI